MKLYHYTTLDSFAKIWVSKQLKFSPPQNTNDLFERSKPVSMICLPNLNTQEEDITAPFFEFWDSYKKILHRFKQISLVRDYNDCLGCLSPLMWGQYAHNDQGVCIELDSKAIKWTKNLFHSKVFYKKALPPIILNRPVTNDNRDIRKFIVDNRKLFFFMKHKHWEHENEYRIVSDTLDYLSIQGAVTKIYVSNHNHINTKVVECLVNNEVAIDYLNVRQFIDKKDLTIGDLRSLRKTEKLLAEEPDYYNKDKVRVRFKEKFKITLNNDTRDKS